MIVHIVDVSSPSREKQESAVSGVLDEMKVSDKPRLTLWNKLDMLPEEEQEQVRVDAEDREELTVAASAKTGQGLDDFVTCLEVCIFARCGCRSLQRSGGKQGYTRRERNGRARIKARECPGSAWGGEVHVRGAWMCVLSNPLPCTGTDSPSC